MKRALLGAVALAAACGGSGDTSVNVSVAPSLIFPHTLLTAVTSITVSAYDVVAGVDCTTTTGVATTAGKTPIGSVQITASGGTFSGTLTIPESPTDRVFAATGINASNVQIAIGCARTTVNQSTLPLTIKMVRFIPPANCGDGTVQPTESCDDTSAICKTCQTVEVAMSAKNTAAGTGTVAGNKGDKFGPSLVWASGAGLFAFFTDKTAGSNDLALGALDKSMLPAGQPYPGVLATGEIYMPTDPSTFPGTPTAGSQSAPSAVVANGEFYVVYQDDQFGNGLDVHFRSMNAQSLAADQGGGAPLGVNGLACTSEPCAGDANSQSTAQISTGPKGTFIVWQDDATAAIFGRLFTLTSATTATLGTQIPISGPGGNSAASVAATASGWVVVWQNGSDVSLRAISATGTDATPAGGATTVDTISGSTQDHPRIASLSDGRYAVVWHSTGGSTPGIYMQRFDINGGPISGDQNAPINNLIADGTQAAPAIAAIDTGGLKGYAIAWTGGDGHIHARYADGTNGFLFNNVTGQADEFQASAVDGHARITPVVAVGGAGFVAFAWEDQASPFGIFARRFPLPPASL